jgi:O-antigen/teichoic acid export membrane protein
MLGHLIYGTINIIGSGIVFERKVIYHVYIFSLALLFNAALNFLLIPRIVYMAAAYTTLASYVLVALLVGVVSNRLYKIRWEPKRLLQICASGVLVIVVASAASSDGVVAIVTKVMMMIALLVSWYFFVLSGWEKTQLRSVLRNMRWWRTATAV